MKLLPFRLPYPFIRASQYPCAVVLRPTTGDFLNDYNNSTDLHIAVTTSKGTIVEFDRNGLQRHSDKSGQSSWSQCLLVENVPEPWHELWDEVLLQICKQPNWTTDDYNEEAYNCYTFVLTFLQAVGYSALSKDAENKTYFCEKYIVPRTTTAGKYISLYRKIRDYGLYTHSVGKDMSSHSGSSAAGLRGNFYGVKLCTIKE
ncbi:MKRN2 opposite strand protein [Hermetia illucens]|uniref:MKRN2 opposite strand protein n=1 Tax=Hermetia illucens TaxID=343691 RepID=UPI0018CC01A5|nr:MKRN2 opposite strand protein [Hermetia illucens]